MSNALQDGRTRRPRSPRASFDVLRLPLLGRFLCWRYSRMVLQIPLFLLSLIMIGHAFWGPQLAPKNLAALLTWVHFRGLVVLVLLAAGNLFCMACPFMLPRDLARRWITPGWNWPRPLRNKWLAVFLFVSVLFIYELFDLWASPWWTGMLIVGYFTCALVVDLLFKHASFCKYVCPVGQFNFLCSTISPLEVAIRDPETCAACRTKDCIRGTHGSPESSGNPIASVPLPVIQRGCELALYQPRKVGNLDCTFCLDCVYACPHENIGLMARLPAEELGLAKMRSGVGNIVRRFDFTALIIVFTFGAILNAFAMISPVYALETWIASVTGLRVEWPILMALFTVALVLEPAILLTGTAAISRRLTHSTDSVLAIVQNYSRSLLPLGFGIWLAHYGFHFFTGFLTVIPITQHAVLRIWGTPWLGAPRWQLGGLPESVVFPLEIGFLGMGLLGSWLVTWMIAQHHTSQRSMGSFLPWAALHGILFMAAVWIMTQPMEMRGTLLEG